MPNRRALLLGLPALILLAGCGSQNAEAAAPAPGRTGDGLTVVELFQSQGCSSCPPAIRNVNALADRKDLLVLTFSVTYWDYLGWKDSFGKPAFTTRQRDFSTGHGGWGVYTPQVVVNGSAALVGDRAEQIGAVINRSGRVARLGISSRSPDAVTLAAMPGIKQSADVWLVRYDPASRNVPIRAGENAGRTIAHRNIVVDFQRIGSWDGRSKRIDLPAASSPNLATALFVQLPRGGSLIAAAKI